MGKSERACSGDEHEVAMQNNWEEYAKHYVEIMAYLVELRERHGRNGADVMMDDLAARLARHRAGIDEAAVYGS